MIASVEWRGWCRCVGVVRTHPTGGLGAPYSWCVMVERRHWFSRHVKILAMQRAPTMAEYRAVCRLARCHGVTFAGWDRHRPDGAVESRGKHL